MKVFEYLSLTSYVYLQFFASYFGNMLHTILYLKSMIMFLNYLLKVKVTQTRNWLKTCHFLLFKVIYSQFVVILSLYVIAINVIKYSLNTNTFLLHNASKVKVKVI